MRKARRSTARVALGSRLTTSRELPSAAREHFAKHRPRIIAVSSGGAGEGKTTCAINLAFVMCERSLSKVLLLEGNFFEPSLGEIFHIDAAPAPSMDLPWLTPYRIAEVVRGFNDRWFEMVVDNLSAETYDHLIIDAPALDGSPAATQIARVADGTLFTVRSGGTTAKTLRRAAEQVPRDRVLGIALMDGEL